jgi:hypothetical protein
MQFIEKVYFVAPHTLTPPIQEVFVLTDDLTTTEISNWQRIMMDSLVFIDLLSKSTALTYTQLLKDTIQFIDLFRYDYTPIFEVFTVEPMPLVDILHIDSRVTFQQFLRDPLMLIDRFMFSGGFFYNNKTFTEAFTFLEHLVPTYWEGCLDYDYLVATFDALTMLAGGKSIARILEQIDP